MIEPRADHSLMRHPTGTGSLVIEAPRRAPGITARMNAN
jgi:hypothetical protein